MNLASNKAKPVAITANIKVLRFLGAENSQHNTNQIGTKYTKYFAMIIAIVSIKPCKSVPALMAENS
jgi:hypothetical protein